MKIQVQALAQTSIVNKKELYYLVMGEGDSAYAINVGLTTYEKVKELLGEKVTKKEDKK